MLSLCEVVKKKGSAYRHNTILRRLLRFHHFSLLSLYHHTIDEWNRNSFFSFTVMIAKV